MHHDFLRTPTGDGGSAVQAPQVYYSHEGHHAFAHEGNDGYRGEAASRELYSDVPQELVSRYMASGASPPIYPAASLANIDTRQPLAVAPPAASMPMTRAPQRVQRSQVIQR